MLNKRFVFWYIFTLGIFCVYLYFSGIVWAWIFLLSLIFYCLLAYWIHIIWKRLRRGSVLSVQDFVGLFFYKVSLFVSIIFIVFGSFIYYQNNISPAMMPQYTITNGEQTIIFQTMSHIGSQKFYDTVQRDIQSYKQQGYVLYFEGVGPGNEQNSKDFNTALWINFDTELYDNFSKLYGVVAQNNEDFLNIENNLDYNIDINIDEIMDIYRKKTTSSSSWTKSSFMQSNELQDVNSLILEQLAWLNETQLKVIRYINQSLLNFMIKQEKLRNLIVERVANQDLFSVILDQRNAHIVSEIQARWDKKIFILYGLMHFEWVFNLLKTQNPNWEIIHISDSQLITHSQ